MAPSTNNRSHGGSGKNCTGPSPILSCTLPKKTRLERPEHKQEQQDCDKRQEECGEEAHIEDRGGVLLEFSPPDCCPHPPPSAVVAAEVVDREDGPGRSLQDAAGMGAIDVCAAAGGTGHR